MKSEKSFGLVATTTSQDQLDDNQNEVCDSDVSKFLHDKQHGSTFSKYTNDLFTDANN